MAIETIFQRPRADIPHAWLFTGISGGGKTTFSRIIQDMLGCKGNDYTEIDAAGMRGIDTIRDLRDQLNYLPMESECRVWLLDECHALTKDAQTALLKVLEEAPEHVFFILATTDPQNLLPTLKSRCKNAEFEVKALDQKTISDYLWDICNWEKKKVPDDILDMIASDSLGSCRNALQILDKVIDLDPEDMKTVADQAIQSQSQVKELCQALFKRESWNKIAGILSTLEKQEVEKTRRAVYNYCGKVLVSGQKSPQADCVMMMFQEPFFNNGWFGLVHAAYQCVTEMPK